MRMALIAAAVMVATPSTADASDRMGYKAIAAGDLVKAEQVLIAERRIYPNRPELMLNLALVYARTGRLTEARHLYAEVLARRAVALDVPDGSVRSSHDVASAGLNRLSIIAAR